MSSWVMQALHFALAEPWPEAAALLENCDWSFSEEYLSLRHFFIALPVAREQAAL
jgi:hypothetical protein